MTPLLLVAFIGCRGGQIDSGTYVGNPGQMAVRIAPPDGMVVDGSEAPVDRVELLPCGSSEPVAVPVDIQFNLIGDFIEIPEGTYCEVGLYLDGLLAIHVLGEEGGEALLDVDLGWVALSGSTPVEGNALVLEVGQPGWIGAEELGVEDGVAVVINPETDPDAHWELVDRLFTTSALFEDSDANGEVDDNERDLGALAIVVEQDPDAQDTDATTEDPGCACDAGPSRGLLMGLLPLFWVRRRRSVLALTTLPPADARTLGGPQLP